jgi:alternate signal-mediated exported protein
MSSNAEAPRSRSKLTKALVATGVGVALLAGGGGTFATWYDSTTTEGATVTSGDLGLTAGPGVWSNGLKTIDVASYRVVPGETLTFTQNVRIDATGDRLQAVLKPSFTDSVDESNELAKQLRASAVFVVDDVEVLGAGRDITAADNGKTLAVALQVTFPDLGEKKNGTSAQEQSAVLDEITIELEQTALTAAPATTATPVG